MMTDTHRPPESSHTENEPYTCRRFFFKGSVIYLMYWILVEVNFFVVYSKSLKRVRRIVKSHYYLCHVQPSICLSVRMEHSASTVRIFIKFRM